jgi:hypothetical protein
LKPALRGNGVARVEKRLPIAAMRPVLSQIMALAGAAV